jgi:levansucrase
MSRRVDTGAASEKRVLDGQDCTVPAMQTAIWSPDHVSCIERGTAPYLPRVRSQDVHRLGPDLDAWDAWPVQWPTGGSVVLGGAELWMTLAAPVNEDPNLRHQRARMHLIRPTADGGWRDLGPVLPDGFSPGACEWSGCAVWRSGNDSHGAEATGRVELHFTATGRRGQRFTTEQRLFVTTARVEGTGDHIRLVDWTVPTETVPALADWRQPAQGVDPAPGRIHHLRDPAVFQDPSDGQEYLVYAASESGPQTLDQGAIGWAVHDPTGGWRDLGPLLRAPGLNHELERPHLLKTADGYYLFWCTQARMFAAGGPAGPTGLYGMFARQLAGPWTPLNGSGLVAANPEAAPSQTYAWWVTGALEVFGFADVLPDAPDGDRDRVFAGGLAPPFRITLDGPTSRVA